MSHTSRSLGLLGGMVFLCGAAWAQAFLPSGVGTDAYGNYTSAHVGGVFNNPTSAYLAGELQKNQNQQLIMNSMISSMILQELVKEELWKEQGRARISSGGASTTFAPDAAVSLVGGQREGADASQVAAVSRTNLEDFQAQMRARGFATNDVADARALALSMAFAAYTGVDPGAGRLAVFRARIRGELLRSERWQGYADFERQREYEGLAVPAMMAVAARGTAASTGLSDEQRGALISTAKQLAGTVLRVCTPIPPDSLELTADDIGDRAVRLVAEGLGTATFARSREPLELRAYAGQYGFLKKPEGYWDEVLPRFDAVVRAAGGETNNLGDAHAAAFALHYYVMTSGEVELSAAQVLWVREEMRRDVASSVAFQRMGDEARQRLYEQLALQAIRVRDDYVEQLGVLAQPAPADAFEAILDASVKGNARSSLGTDVTTAQKACADIFAPRTLGEFSLTETSFERGGTNEAGHRQDATPESPAQAAYAQWARLRTTVGAPLDGRGLPSEGPGAGSAGKDSGSVPSAPAEATHPTVSTSPVEPTTTFVRAPSVLTAQEFIDGEHGVTADGVATLMGEFDAHVTSHEGAANDLADAKATSFMLLWELDEDELTPAQAAGVRRYFRAQVLASSEVARWDSVRRQQAYERIAVHSMQLVQAFEAEEDLEASPTLRRATAFLNRILEPRSLRTVHMAADGLRDD